MRRAAEAGFTIAELVMVCALVAIMTAMTLPVAKYSVKRRKEMSLRLALRSMRTAIDEHKRLSDQGMIPQRVGAEGYPETLEELVEGIEIVGELTKKKLMRKVPLDPMTRDEWGLRSYQDDFDSTSWGGENIYDVYTTSEAIGLDGTPYNEW